jgi:hypothetical protein
MTKENFKNQYNFEEVYRKGWGLHRKTCEYILEMSDKIKNIVEFGSGGSTKFLLDMRESLSLNFSLDSFDHNKEFCFKPNKDYTNFKLNIRPLVQYDNETYNEMFLNKKLSEKHTLPTDIFNTRLQNCFYKIEANDLKDEYDLVVLDGPSGNGRNIAHLYLLNKLKKNTIIIIDDYNHYDFVEKCQHMFNTEIVVEEKFDHPLKGHCILRVI